MIEQIKTSEDANEITRYELKYAITEELAAGIRDYIRNICTLDKHVPPGMNGYLVNNLYFDTPDLQFYYDSKFRKPIRYKPRARFYGEKATDTIWPEIKYRHASVIWKKRYPVSVEHWQELFFQRKTERREPLVKTRLDIFDDFIHWHDVRSVLHVRYFREPYVTDLEGYGRVTFDRQLCCRSTGGSINLGYDEQDMVYYDDPASCKNDDTPVILEIKVETFVPVWAVELIRTFQLMQRAFSKYCYGIDYLMGYCDNGRRAVLDWNE